MGDGLQAYSIEVLTNHLPKLLDAQQIISIIQELVQACGPAGMVSGQSLDLSMLKDPDISSTHLEHIHQLKTGRLILACINTVLTAAQAPTQEVSALRQFGHHLGILFQMQDDYLDQFGQENALGKGRSSDLANQKQTYANVCSQTALAELINNHVAQAEQSLDIFADRSESLKALLTSIRNRI